MDGKGFGLATAALAVGLVIAWLMLANEVRSPSATDVVLTVGIGWVFVSSGLVARSLRPDNPIGSVMIVGGFLQLGAGLFSAQDRTLFTIGHVLQPSMFAWLTYIVLAFPNGHLTRRLDRWVFAMAALAVGPLQVAWLMVGGHPRHGESCLGCPEVLIEVTHVKGAAVGLEWAQEIIGAVVATASILVLLQRWRRASGPLRFAIAPVLWAGAVALAAIFLYVFSLAIGTPVVDNAAWIVVNLAVGSVALAFLVGVARTRLARSAVADLVVEMGDAGRVVSPVEEGFSSTNGTPVPDALRDSLARALHDPSLGIAFWMEDQGRFVDARGHPIELPVETETRAVTVLERDGRRVAALLHDPVLREDRRLVESVGAAVALQIENERLQAELRAQLAEVEASRKRILETGMKERRRIERALHDGTQQRLVSVGMSLGLAESKVPADPDAALALMREAKGRLSDALEELRDLSQGIHPGILTERGLPAALDELARRVDIPVALDMAFAERLPERVEEAAYFVVSEALANVAKHAHATRVVVRGVRSNGTITMSVSDDGEGGAEVGRGSGLPGLRDRVEALGGRLRVSSPVAVGTVVEAEIPCAS